MIAKHSFSYFYLSYFEVFMALHYWIGVRNERLCCKLVIENILTSITASTLNTHDTTDIPANMVIK